MDAALYTLVTGASSGLGRSTAVRLSRERNLILHGRSPERLEETLGMCLNRDRHVVWAFDLKNPGELADSLTPLLAASARSVEAFVHCAGMVTVLPMRSVDYRVAQEIMNVNFFSAAEIVHTLLKIKVNSRALTNILFISSIWSRFGARGHSAYCASKAALDGLMRALAVELAPAIRVNSILPGAIQTPMAAQGLADPSIAEKLEQDYPMGIGRPDDIVDAIEFVLSGRARWLTGQEIVIDGGRTVNMSLK
ncbi:MAG: SDR family oxidoreductase [Bryobacteraceae bacterium]|jgi:NAD(P)-dependent dehydrogenase (short-subunit alcohol dehydrogenase family)